MTTSISSLPNGIRIITDAVDRVETAAISIWVNVGSRHEPIEITGAAHFIEHMAFKGTPTRTAKEIAESVEAVGGHLNAATAREFTAFYGRVLKEDIPLAMEVLADIMQDSAFEHAEFDRERDVVLQEIAQSQDTPDDIIFDHFQQTAFPGQNLGLPILGTADVIKSVSAETLKSYMRQHYTGGNIVIAVSGNTNHDHVMQLAKEHFGGFPHKTQQPTEDVSYVGGDFRQIKDLEQAHIVMGFEGVSLDDPDYYAASILATILGGGMSSRLFQEVREKRGLVYSVYAFKSSFVDTGLFGVYAGTAGHHVKEMMPVICNEIQKIANTPIPEDEIKRARSQMKAGLMMGLEGMSNRAEQLAQHMTFFGRPIPRAELIDRIDAVDAEALLRVAQKIFSSKPTIAAMGPVHDLPEYTELESLLGNASSMPCAS
ncbi:MAG: M16 family metallopeptidase [Alphaproteobacteria bacterium]